MSVYPEYLTSVHPLICPSDPGAKSVAEAEEDPEDVIDDESYYYLGYVVTSEEELAAFSESYKARIAQGLRFDEDLPIPDGGGAVIPRIREGVEAHVGAGGSANMVRASIPVMWDAVDTVGGKLRHNHIPAGANLLYMDGHVEYVKYNLRFPMTERAMQIMAELDAMGR